jgi:hypothetical protein
LYVIDSARATEVGEIKIFLFGCCLLRVLNKLKPNLVLAATSLASTFIWLLRGVMARASECWDLRG